MTSRLTAKPEGTFFECANCDHAGPMTELIPDDGPDPHPCGKDLCPQCGEVGGINCCLTAEDVGWGE